MADEHDEKSASAWSRRALLAAAAAAAGCGPGELVRPGDLASGDSGLGTGDTARPTGSLTGSVSGGTADTGRTAPPRRPNILLLYPDQWRAQALGHRGDPNAHTPRLDAFAAESVSFTDAVTNSAVCTPARALMLTGVMPWVHDMDDNGARLPDGVPTIGTALRSSGYRCGWIGKWHLEGKQSAGWVAPGRRFGFDDAWAAHNFHHRYLSAELFFDQPVPVRRDDLWQPLWETDLAMEAIDTASEGDAPWFLTVSWGPPHPNELSPADWDLDMPPELMAAIDPQGLVFRNNVPRDQLEPNGNDPYGIRGFLHGYYACIRAMDAEVGRLLDHLAQRGLDRDTLVIFTSDHGEMGGSHGLYKKSIWFEESLRIPMLFRWPAGFGGGRRYAGGASLLDLAPTLLSLCTDDAADPGLQGTDLSPWLRGERADEPERVSFIGRRQGGAFAWRSVRNHSHKLVQLVDSGREQLFDLAADPYEDRNAVDDPEHAATLEGLRAELDAWRVRAADPSVS